MYLVIGIMYISTAFVEDVVELVADVVEARAYVWSLAPGMASSVGRLVVEVIVVVHALGFLVVALGGEPVKDGPQFLDQHRC